MQLMSTVIPTVMSPSQPYVGLYKKNEVVKKCYIIIQKQCNINIVNSSTGSAFAIYNTN